MLPLYDEYYGLPINERRRAAGGNFRGRRSQVLPGTIRTYYEPRALEALAAIPGQDGGEHRGEHPPEAA